jgi:LuxR family quorum-sensing system transcriptional regulator CciR
LERASTSCGTPQSKMFDRVDAFVRDVSKVKSEEELSDLLIEVSRELGFSYFALTHHVDIRTAPKPVIRLHNYPSDWEDYFNEHKLGACDPVHRASHLTSIGFTWSQVPDMISLTPRDRQVLERAGARGIRDGFTVPAHVPGESNGSCTFATSGNASLKEEHLPAAQLIGAFGFEAARHLWGVREAGGSRPQLTDRQRDCLVWAARGKSDWEISRILGVSHETVIRHLKQARERYGVGKRTLLAIHALFDGSIGFTDVLRR